MLQHTDGSEEKTMCQFSIFFRFFLKKGYLQENKAPCAVMQVNVSIS